MEYLSLDLGVSTEVYGVQIQGRADADEWIKTFKIAAYNDGYNKSKII